MALKNRTVKNCLLAALLICFIKLITLFLIFTDNVPRTFEATTGHGMRYMWKNKTGKSFLMSSQLQYSLSEVGYPIKNYVDSLKPVLNDFVFATAVSASYVPYVMDGIATIQEHFPGRKIIVFNLGREGDTWTTEVKSLCNVELRNFDFTEFPRHVKTLKNCAWKVLIVHTLLKEYPGVFWVDSSIRFTSGDLKETFGLVESTGGVCHFISTWHSNHVVSQPVHYEYFPTDIEQQKLTEQSGAGIFLMYRTRHVYENIMKWLLLCALEEHCINPGTYGCNFKHNRWTTNARCSRFDQSILNLLLSNYFGFDNLIYTTQTGGDKNVIFDVKRKSKENHTPQKCE